MWQAVVSLQTGFYFSLYKDRCSIYVNICMYLNKSKHAIN